MKKFYIPTSSLNFNNILSSESISPKAFYQERSFGYSRWINIPENPYNNSIVLYDGLCTFSRPISDIEDHPLLIEILIDEVVESTLVKIDEHIFLSDHTIYIDPFSTKLYFFSDRDKTIALSLSDSSVETKFVRLYQKKIEVIAPTGSSYPILESSAEKQALNTEEIDKDKKINRMRGLLYGYYIGALLSAEIGDVRKLNTAREIRDILAAILASYDHQATAQQRERLKSLYATIQLFSELSTQIPDKRLFEAVASLVHKYCHIHGEMINVDSIISNLLAYRANSDEKNPVVEKVNSLIRQTEKEIQIKARPVSVDDGQIVVVDGVLTNINILNAQDKILYMAWINDVLSKDEYSGKTSTFKETLSDDVTRKAKEICDGEWKGSYPEVTLNALRRHVRGDEFPHSWGDDIISSISALIIRGDEWQKLLQFMQSKGMTDYRVAFSMYGTINGLANLPRDFTDVLFNRGSKYIAEVYKEFYGQLFGRDVVIPQKEEKAEEAQKSQPMRDDVPEDMPKDLCYSTITSERSYCEDKVNDVISKLQSIKKYRLKENTIKSIVQCYKDSGYCCNKEFYKSIKDNIKGIGDSRIVEIEGVLGLETTDEIFNQANSVQPETSTIEATVSFVSDNDIIDIVHQMNIQDENIVDILIDDIKYIQSKHKKYNHVDNAECIKHLDNLIYSKKWGKHLEPTDENKKITNELINRLVQRYK